MLMWPKAEQEVNSHDVITSPGGQDGFSLHAVESVSDDYNFISACVMTGEATGSLKSENVRDVWRRHDISTN